MENIKMTQKNKGFTLIELMITVAIIGILASLAVPAYREYVRKAKFAEGFAITAPIRTALAVYCGENGNFKPQERHYLFNDQRDLYKGLGIIYPSSYAERSAYVVSISLYVETSKTRVNQVLDQSYVRLNINYSFDAVSPDRRAWYGAINQYIELSSDFSFTLRGDCTEAGLTWVVDKERTSVPERFWNHLNLNE